MIAKAFISAGCESVLTTGSALQGCWDLQLLDGQAEDAMSVDNSTSGDRQAGNGVEKYPTGGSKL